MDPKHHVIDIVSFNSRDSYGMIVGSAYDIGFRHTVNSRAVPIGFGGDREITCRLVVDSGGSGVSGVSSRSTESLYDSGSDIDV